MKQMKQNRTYERGQAIILIVLAMIGMIGMVALAIDGGNVFLNRRSAQNAADSAALAGALAKAQGQIQSLTDPQILTALTNAAISSAASNNFNNDGTSNTVTVSNPPGAGCNATNGPYAGNAEYLQMIIRTTIQTYFAPIVGIRTLSNCVEAIAHVKPGDPYSLCYKAVLCALSSTDSRALQTYGGANVTLSLGDAFSNSNDATQSAYISNNSTIKMDPGQKWYAVGGILDQTGLVPIAPFSGNLIPAKPQLSYPLPSVMIPKYTCDYNLNDLPQDLPGGLPYLKAGVYCISGKFNKADYTNGTTDGTDIGGVTIIMLNYGLSWTGTTNINLNAPPDCNHIPLPIPLPTYCNSPHETPLTAGLLIYLPYGNKNNEVKFAGTGALQIVGTILAPDVGSLINYNGNYATGTFLSQLVGWNMQIGGGATGTIKYPPFVYEYLGPPTITLVK